MKKITSQVLYSREMDNVLIVLLPSTKTGI